MARMQNINRLIRDLGSEDRAVYMRAGTRLDKIGSEVIPFLESVIGDADEAWLRRKNAAQLLGSMAPASSAPVLIAGLSDSNRNVQQGCAVGLAMMREPSAVPHLIPLLQAEGIFIRARAAYALTQIGGDDAALAIAGFIRRSCDELQMLDSGRIPPSLEAATVELWSTLGYGTLDPTGARAAEAADTLLKGPMQLIEDVLLNYCSNIGEPLARALDVGDVSDNEPLARITSEILWQIRRDSLRPDHKPPRLT